MARVSDGVLLVDKPGGPTSHDVVAQARRLFGTRSIGHAGTLDPMATGLLVLLVGRATKLAGYLSAEDKRYRARVSFGVSTDTLDALGVVVEQRELAHGWLERELVERALAAERSRSEQVPPSVSAIKVAGQPAYRASRRGQPMALAPRQVAVKSLALLEIGHDWASFELCVQKGYYVRAFARDLGMALGVPSHLSELRRLASGCFDLDEAVRWPLPAPPPLMTLEQAASRALPVARLTVEGARRAKLGQPLALEHFAEDALGPHGAREDQIAAWLDPDGTLLAIGRPASNESFRVVRGI